MKIEIVKKFLGPVAQILVCAYVISFQAAVAAGSDKTGRNFLASRSRIESWKIGGGVGYSFYLSNQMDYAITKKFGEFTELIPCYQAGVAKTLNNTWEVYAVFRNGHMFTLKSENTQGLSCDYNEFQINADYSLNHNALFQKSRYTLNAQMGLGATYFRSQYMKMNAKTQTVSQIFSTVGYNGTIISIKDQPEKQLAIIGNLGIVAGFSLNRYMSIYWENLINISTSNKMTGNLFKRSWIPPDGYYYTGLSLYIQLSGGRSDQLGCPKF